MIASMRFVSVIIALQIVSAVQVVAFSYNRPSTRHARRIEPLHAVNGVWNTGNDFGKGKFRFYEGETKQPWPFQNIIGHKILHKFLFLCVTRCVGLDSFMKPFPDEDRALYPEMFKLPKGVYEVPLAKPCGIIFEEIDVNRGVYIADLVEGGNAARQGILQKGDVLVGLTAIRVAGAKWERRLLPARNFGFDLVVNAIGSNEQKWGCNNVILMVERPGEANKEEVDKFLEFFEPPADTPWKLPV
ncbi:hypothetical protein HJC23_009173 [Cyclotella cryptica]|uniref:PDZ domain-containing protein n=1 Tax=Cyclotella cryptica TaxID=29204 RepID=A0ABD3PK43_9STRA